MRGVPSLRETEQERKIVWIQRIRAIRGRAGLAARAAVDAAECGMSSDDFDVLVLGRGAWRTLRTHVRAWLAFEEWSHDDAPFPPTLRRFRAFCAAKAAEGCGVAFIPAARAAMAWMGRRIGMEVPPMSDDLVRALEDRVIEQRGKEIKEAAPVPMEVVAALERALHGWDEQGLIMEVILTWWLLCMIWASMRFDDALHIRPDSLQMGACALRGKAWQTKVERKRRGTCFAICDVAVSAPGWLQKGLARYREMLPKGLEEIDFWLCDIHAGGLNFQTALTYDRFVSNARNVVKRAVEEFWEGPEEMKEFARETARRFTGHSPRVTMINAMAHGGADAMTLMAQGNWKDGAMPFKYIRDRKAIPLNFIVKMAKDLAAAERRPGGTGEGAPEGDAAEARELFEASASGDGCFDLTGQWGFLLT